LDAANPKSYPGSGIVWKDLSGNGNDGTLVNGVGYDSMNNGSMVFDGTNQYSEFAEVTLSNSGACLNAWCYIEDFNTSSDIPAVTLVSNDIAFRQLVSFWDGGYGFETNSNSDPVEFAGETSAPILADGIRAEVWVNFSLVFNGGISYGYINGTSVDTRSISNSMSIRYIGRSPGISNYPSWFKGNISNVQIYNRALAESEIKQNFEALRGRYGI
jgi:hypothetical protein